MVLWRATLGSSSYREPRGAQLPCQTEMTASVFQAESSRVEARRKPEYALFHNNPIATQSMGPERLRHASLHGSGFLTGRREILTRR